GVADAGDGLRRSLRSTGLTRVVTRKACVCRELRVGELLGLRVAVDLDPRRIRLAVGGIRTVDLRAPHTLVLAGGNRCSRCERLDERQQTCTNRRAECRIR